ncbi:hypothetical protein M514_03074 [Trichuris suis]|uniref:Calcium release-activated calcium channel protein 1 n=1 Tax=Trichuris suis TaxID=68888 RepID=A0A085NFP8_9BILA|nr:hypothetical protein M514_03074 [Trichuris suis]
MGMLELVETLGAHHSTNSRPASGIRGIPKALIYTKRYAPHHRPKNAGYFLASMPALLSCSYLSLTHNICLMFRPRLRRKSFSLPMDHALSLRQLHLSRAKLKATSQTSALLAGFAMVRLILSDFSFYEQLDLDSNNPSWHPITVPVLIAFGICTTLLVGVHLLALMMSTCMLPHMDSVLNSPNYEVISESPHVRMKWYIEVAWCFSTVFGLLLFLLEIGIVFWIKFTAIKATNVTYITTGILALILVVFLCFTFTFYNKLTMHKYELSKGRLDDLQQYYSTFEPNEEYDVEKVVNEVCKTANMDEVIKVV